MVSVKIDDKDLQRVAGEGIDSFLELVIKCMRDAIGGEITAENMQQMSTAQTVLMGYATLRDELMDGGFIQLIYNGYGPFFFHNPFDAAVRQWGLVDLCRLMRRAKKQYQRHCGEIEREMTDEEFMALYEKLPDFEDLDDEFVSNEEQWSAQVAYYVDEHLEELVQINKLTN